MCYILWFDSEKPPPDFIATRAMRVARTTRQARKIIEKDGLPLIVSFGAGSIDFAKFLASNFHLTYGFTFRVHHEPLKKVIAEIMRNEEVDYTRKYGERDRRTCVEA